NSDIPIDRCDASISFCLFMSITVLIRNVRICRQKAEQLEQTATSTAASSPSADGDAESQQQQQHKHQRMHEIVRLKDELFKSANTLRRMWNMLKNLGFMWTIEGMEQLLRTMQVEEIANASDMFSGLSL
ncbi:hypothetical protein GGI22_008064, partial [Coemansia erecta]